MQGQWLDHYMACGHRSILTVEEESIPAGLVDELGKREPGIGSFPSPPRCLLSSGSPGPRGQGPNAVSAIAVPSQLRSIHDSGNPVVQQKRSIHRRTQEFLPLNFS